MKDLAFPSNDLERRRMEAKVKRGLFALDACVPVTFAYNAVAAEAPGKAPKRSATNIFAGRRPIAEENAAADAAF